MCVIFLHGPYKLIKGCPFNLGEHDIIILVMKYILAMSVIILLLPVFIKYCSVFKYLGYLSPVRMYGGGSMVLSSLRRIRRHHHRVRRDFIVLTIT